MIPFERLQLHQASNTELLRQDPLPTSNNSFVKVRGNIQSWIFGIQKSIVLETLSFSCNILRTEKCKLACLSLSLGMRLIILAAALSLKLDRANVKHETYSRLKPVQLSPDRVSPVK